MRRRRWGVAGQSSPGFGHDSKATIENRISAENGSDCGFVEPARVANAWPPRGVWTRHSAVDRTPCEAVMTQDERPVAAGAVRHRVTSAEEGGSSLESAETEASGHDLEDENDELVICPICCYCYGEAERARRETSCCKRHLCAVCVRKILRQKTGKRLDHELQGSNRACPFCKLTCAASDPSAIRGVLQFKDLTVMAICCGDYSPSVRQRVEAHMERTRKY